MYLTLTEMILLFFFLSGFVAWHLQNSTAFFVLFFNLSFSVLHVSTSLLHLDQSDLGVLLDDCQ